MILRQKKQECVIVLISESDQNFRLAFKQCLKDSVDDFIQIKYEAPYQEFHILYNVYENVIEYK